MGDPGQMFPGFRCQHAQTDLLDGSFEKRADFFFSLESPKFSRHAGLDPASNCRIILKMKWIPAFAGMTTAFLTLNDFSRLKELWTVQTRRNNCFIRKCNDA